MELLIVIPSELECKGIITHNIPKHCICGVGLVSAAVNVSQVIAQNRPEALLLLGICGAYDSAKLCCGDVVRVDECVLADFGAQNSDEAFLPFASMNLGRSTWSSSPLTQFPTENSLLANRLQTLRGVRSASVQRACGTDALAHERVAQSGAQIEEMEGAAIFACAEAFGVPAFHVRAVSNRAGLRDRSSWKIADALQSLQTFLNGAP